ncbi:hypothetical protein PybrP1_009341 [[Pythium] brassicae (nom. inval.)]|nr:hypothetical protein PybrP1_009341 [[Pythium] brassicae (nom. inval.)]
MSFSFGGTSVAQPAASSFNFGSSTPPAGAPATSSGFSFGTATTPTPGDAGGGGFSFGSSTGSASPSTAAPAPSGFSFGGAGAGSTSTAARSLFGSSPSATGTAPTSGFSFGAPSTGSSSLFGGSTAAPGTGGSSFFGGINSTAAPATGGSSFFAASGTGAAPSTGGSGFFGGSGAAAPSTGSSLFGATTGLSAPGASATASPFSFGFGGAAPAAAAPQLNGAGITLETAFEALPTDVKKNVAEFHKVLKEADQADAVLKTVSPRPLDALSANIQRLDQDVLARRNVQDRQATAVHHARKDTKHVIRQVDAATLSLRSLDGNSAASAFHIQRRVETPSPYYWDLLDHFEGRMLAIKAQIEDLESEARPLSEQRGSGSALSVSPALLHQILVAQNASLMQVAARVAEVHERAEELRQAFLVQMRADMARHGEQGAAAAARNPFARRKQSAHGDKRETIDKIRFRTSVAPTIVAPAPAPVAAPAATSGFGGFGAAPASSSLFGSAPTGASSAFGTTPAATSGSLLFGAPAAAAPAAGATSGFSFGGGGAAPTAPTTTTAAAPKQVSFNLGPTTTAFAAPAAPSASTFSVPSVATSGSAFSGASGVSFATGDAEKRAASSKRLGGRAKKRA